MTVSRMTTGGPTNGRSSSCLPRQRHPGSDRSHRRGRYRKAIKLFEGITELQHRYGNRPPDLQPGSPVVKRGEGAPWPGCTSSNGRTIYRDGRFLISVIGGRRGKTRRIGATGRADWGCHRALRSLCRDHKPSIETLLGCEVRSDVETKPVQQLGAVLTLSAFGSRRLGARNGRV